MISEKIQNLTTENLRSTNNRIAAHKRKIDSIFIEHLAETIKRRAYLDWGFTSMYDYLTQELKFSGSAAFRRLEAARAFLQMPEIKNDIETGALNLTQICKAQTAIRHEQKSATVTLEERRDLFAELRNTSSRETEKIIDRKFETLSPAPVEKHKHDDSVELSLRLPKETYEKFSRVKELLSHSIPDGNWVEVLNQVADTFLEKNDPVLKELRPTKRSSKSKSKSESESKSEPQSYSAQCGTAAAVNSNMTRRIRPTVKRFVFQRDRVCQFKHENGVICGSRHQLEIDHIQPVFAGGSNEVSNLRVLCRAHNQFRYQRGR